jgi:hypothetical protein
MDERGRQSEPYFKEGTEVAKARRLMNSEAQLSLLAPEPDLRRKLVIAAAVILSIFIAGMIFGAVLGILA